MLLLPDISHIRKLLPTMPIHTKFILDAQLKQNRTDDCVRQPQARAQRCYKPITLSSLYAAQYWGYLPLAPPKASCQVSIKISIFSLTFKSGCRVEFNNKAENILVPVHATLKRRKMEAIRDQKSEKKKSTEIYSTFFFTILTMSCKISRSTI